MTDDHRSMFALVVAAILGLGGCTLITDSFLTNDFSGDPYPIDVETETGAIVVGLRKAGEPDRVAVVDLLSPFTVLDTRPRTNPSVSYADVVLLGKPGPGAAPGGAIDLGTAVPRARFRGAQLITLHPCPDDGEDGAENPNCVVGVPSTTAGVAEVTRVFQAIIGADVLAGDAVRLRLGDHRMFILADVGGSDAGRTRSCDAVFNSPYRGGGTLVISGTELPFGNRRITLRACLGPDPDPVLSPVATAPRQHGADVLLVMSTSIGISILGQSAYERYRIAVAGDVPAPPPAFDDLDAAAVYLPSGLTRGRIARIERFRLALVGASTSNPLAPCRQLYAHRFLTTRNCSTEEPDDCPCKNGEPFCDVPAAIAFEPPEVVDILVLPDTDPTLQALRTELRPDQPEVDGLLGTNVLRTAEIDVDYPHDRLIARCTDGNCTARPQLALEQEQEQERTQITGCLDGQPTGPISPGL